MTSENDFVYISTALVNIPAFCDITPSALNDNQFHASRRLRADIRRVAFLSPLASSAVYHVITVNIFLNSFFRGENVFERRRFT